jgi:hypothetical protein
MTAAGGVRVNADGYRAALPVAQIDEKPTAATFQGAFEVDGATRGLRSS